MRVERPITTLVEPVAVPQTDVAVFATSHVADNPRDALPTDQRRPRPLPPPWSPPSPPIIARRQPLDDGVAVACSQERAERLVAEDVLLSVGPREAILPVPAQCDRVLTNSMTTAVAI